jgi:cyclic pyranopterin phosphate synthase
MAEETLAAVCGGGLKKGDALAVARVAGIMAAKKTAELIPLCHPLALSRVTVDFQPRPGQGRLDITAEAGTTGPTGVEMEALTAAAVAALTVYDMAKAIDRAMTVTEIKLMMKDGGASGLFRRA